MKNLLFALFGCFVALAEALAAPGAVDQPLAADAPGNGVIPHSHAMVEGVASYLKGAVSDINGNSGEATEGYLAALAEDPDNVELRQRVLELALLGGDMDTALRLAKTLGNVDQTTMGHLVLAADAIQQNNLKDARKQIQRAAKSAPGLLQFELMKAYVDYASGVKVDVIAKRLEGVDLPALLEGRRQYHLGRLWLKAGNSGEAIKHLEKAHQLEPSAIFTVLLLGEVYEKEGKLDEARALYGGFETDNPTVALLVPSADALKPREDHGFATSLQQDMASALFDFSLLVWGEGAMGPARQLMNLTLWLYPDEPHYRYYAGVLLEVGEDFAAAVSEYEKLENVEEVSVAAKLRLAEARFKAGDRERGWKDAVALAKQHPEISAVHRSLALLAFDQGEFARAAEEYGVLLDKLPAAAPDKTRVELLFARGAAYERAGKYKQATRDLEKALEVDPTHADVMNYLGYMWVDRGERLDEAFVLLKKAHLLAPEDGAITDSVGWAYYKRGDYDMALKYLDAAAEQDPESPEIFSHLGDVYAKVGKSAEAQRYWRQAIGLLDRGMDAPYAAFRKEVEKKLDR